MNLFTQDCLQDLFLAFILQIRESSCIRRVMRSGDEYRRGIWATDWIPRGKSQVAYHSRVRIFSRTCNSARKRRSASAADVSSVRAISRSSNGNEKSISMLRFEITSGAAPDIENSQRPIAIAGIINLWAFSICAVALCSRGVRKANEYARKYSASSLIS